MIALIRAMAGKLIAVIVTAITLFYFYLGYKQDEDCR